MSKQVFFRTQKGFSLVEIIIGLFFVFVIFGLVMLEVGTLNISRIQRYEDVAYHVANKQMEDLRATPFASLAASGTISDSELNQIPSGAGNYTVADYPGYTGMKKITVTVTWNDGSGAKSVVIQTLATAGLINQ